MPLKKMQALLIRIWREEEGVETFEWIALSLVMIVLLGAVASFMKGGGGNTIGNGIVTAIDAWLKQLSNTNGA